MAPQWSLLKVKPSHLYDDGFLCLREDPVAWIEHNHSDRLSVRKLELYGWYDGEKIGDSITELSELTHLSIQQWMSLKCVTNVLSLHNLQVLIIFYCENLEKLPENIGDLTNLTHFELSNCRGIKYLPNSVRELPKLSTLKVTYCESLEALPPNLNVVKLSLVGFCKLKTIPRGLTKLQHFDLELCNLSEEGVSNLMDAKTLRHLSINDCWKHPVKELPAIFNVNLSLDTLTIRSYSIKKLPSFARLHNLQRLQIDVRLLESAINLDEMPQLLLLDIHSCQNIKCLFLSQPNLLNLQFLRLPEHFILETLPLHLNDFVIIHVENRYIRKSWKQIKQEPLYVGASQPFVTESAQYHSVLHASGYLALNKNPSTCIPDPYLVRILDWKLPYGEEKIGGVIGTLPNLTHLYISGQNNLRCLPDSTTRLTHLSLYDCDLKSLCDSLGKLSNLKYLGLVSNCRAKRVQAPLNLLSSLEHLTLQYKNYYSLSDSVAKLSKLNTLELCYCCKVSLPENLNLNKLKLVKSTVKSFPTSLCHLEIIHNIQTCSADCIFDFEMCLKKLVNLKTLSFTCYKINYLPAIAGHQFLRTLEFKDCFNLRELMPNLIEFEELCNLDLSGTRIKSLPECITNLPNLQHLILPKCFRQRNLPNQFFKKDSIVKIEFDTTDKYYYKVRGYPYESSTEASDEENEITPGSVVGLDELQGRESGEDGIVNVHTSSSQMPNPSEANQGVIAVDFQFSEWNFSTGENSHHATHYIQNQEMENLSSGLHSVDNAKDITRFNSEFQETINFYENRQMEPMNLENVVAVTSFDQLISGASAHDVNNHYDVVDPENNNPDGGHKKGNKQKIEIHHDQIQSLRDEHISLVEAAKKLGVSRSTMKRRCKELGLGEWPSSKQKKSDSTKKRRITTKSPPRGEPSQPNLVECSNPADPDYALECLELNQHNSSEQEVPESNFIDHTTANATTDCVEDLNVATHRHVNVHESVPKCTVGTNGHSLLGNVQESLSSSSFDIKATYKDDMVRFKWSSTASLEELKKAVVENLEIELGSFKLKYQDEEDDWLLIKTSEHLESALNSIKNNILRLKVIDV